MVLLPAAPGTGIIAGGAPRLVLELAGVKNILSKMIGSSNKVNNVKAVFEALKAMKSKQQLQRSPRRHELTNEKDTMNSDTFKVYKGSTK